MMVDTKQLLERETLDCLLAAYIGEGRWGLMPPTERAVARFRMRQALSASLSRGAPAMVAPE